MTVIRYEKTGRKAKVIETGQILYQGGLEIEVLAKPQNGMEYNWIQTIVNANSPAFGFNAPYNDPPNDGSYPFYYEKGQEKYVRNLVGGGDPYFQDGPYRDLKISGTVWMAELTLVRRSVGETAWSIVETISYGFGINGGQVSTYPVQRTDGYSNAFYALMLYYLNP